MVHTKRGGIAASCALCHAMLAVDDITHSKQCKPHQIVVVRFVKIAHSICAGTSTYVHVCVGSQRVRGHKNDVESAHLVHGSDVTDGT
jgi:hypothetical protein